MEKFLVINADDFGLSRGINRGIVDAHRRGVVTSTSVMVDAPCLAEAVAMSRDLPDLGLGLHFVATDEDGPLHDLHHVEWMRSELFRQWEKFVEAVGAFPTHLDSHHHVHRKKHVAPLFVDFAAMHGVPLRRQPPVTYWGFHAQWEYKVTVPEYVSVATLTDLLSKLPLGAHEIGCHPGYVSEDFQSIYNAERELEVQTLTDPRIPLVLKQHSITLINYRQMRLPCLAAGGQSGG